MKTQNKQKTISINPVKMLTGGEEVIENLLNTFDTSLEEIVSYPIQRTYPEKRNSLPIPLGWNKLDAPTEGTSRGKFNFKINQDGENVSLLGYRNYGDNKTFLSTSLYLITAKINDFLNFDFPDKDCPSLSPEIKQGGYKELGVYFDIKLKGGKLVGNPHNFKKSIEIVDYDNQIILQSNVSEKLDKHINRIIYEDKDFDSLSLKGVTHYVTYDEKGQVSKCDIQERRLNPENSGVDFGTFMYKNVGDSLVLQGQNCVKLVDILLPEEFKDLGWPEKVELRGENYHFIVPKKDWLECRDKDLRSYLMEIDAGFKSILVPSKPEVVNYNIQTTPVDFKEFISQVPRSNNRR